MTALRSILAATDFSEDARCAAQRAAMLCATAGVSRGVLLHVIEHSWIDSLKRFFKLATDVDQSVVAGASQALDEMVTAVRERSGIALEPQVRVGTVLDAILEASADFDLLVLGARGMHPLPGFSMGTTAQGALRGRNKPVLVVRREPSAPYQRALVAVDFSPHSKHALALGEAIAPQGGLYLAHVFESPFEAGLRFAGVNEEAIQEYLVKARRQAEMEMSQFVDSSGVDGDRLTRLIEHGGHVPTKLLEMARATDADLVVVGRHGKSTVEKLLLGSVTLRLVAECPCDLLVT